MNGLVMNALTRTRITIVLTNAALAANVDGGNDPG
jgi:hypothetical protein